MDNFLNFVGNAEAVFSLVFIAGLALGAWLGYSKKDAEEKLQ